MKNGPNPMDLKQKLFAGGGEEKVEEQHRAGKKTARERMVALLDAGSFIETDVYLKAHDTDAPAEGVVAGYGTVQGRPVYVYAQDYTVLQGSLSATNAKKICKVMDMAVKTGTPVVALLDTAGARIKNGVSALDGYATVMRKTVQASGVIPQIAVVMGPCAGAAAVAAELQDVVIAVDKTAQLSGRGAGVLSAAGSDFDAGAMSANACGNASLFAADDEAALVLVQQLLGYLPDNNLEDAPMDLCADDLNRACPELDGYVPGQGDIRTVIAALCDNGDSLEMAPYFAMNMTTALGRINGRTVGFVANNPLDKGGVMDVDACEKAARFVSLCDCFNLPVVTLVDSNGLPACGCQEKAGLVRATAKLAYSYAAASVAKVTLVTGRAIGSAYVTMASRGLGSDLVYAWPQAEIAPLEADAAAIMVYDQEIEASEDPIAARNDYAEQYRTVDASPVAAASKGLVDDILAPSESRPVLASALELLQGKREEPVGKKHGVMPM